jgi:hypothetical protein
MGTPTTASYRTTPSPQRTELLHHLLVRASAGLVAYRHDGPARTVFVDGEAAVDVYALGISTFHALGWLHWWRDAPIPGQTEIWWCCHLTPAGEAVLDDWDAQVRAAAAA